MFAFVKNWIQNRKDRAFRGGYDWMAGELLRGERSCTELEEEQFSRVFDITSFDQGAVKALADWKHVDPKVIHHIFNNYSLGMFGGFYEVSAEQAFRIARVLRGL